MHCQLDILEPIDEDEEWEPSLFDAAIGGIAALENSAKNFEEAGHESYASYMRKQAKRLRRFLCQEAVDRGD